MNNVRYFIILFVALFFSLSTFAQLLRENEVVVIQGEKFVLHQVRTGETITSISRDFEIEQAELTANNPRIVEEGLNIGEILKIPYKEGVNIQNANPQKGDPSGFIIHKIESRKETPYFISKEYGITVEELYAYNPEINRYRKGTEVRIPRWEVATTSSNIINGNNEQLVTSGEKELVEHQVLSGETLNSIARKYNVSVSEILFFNPGANNLKAGTKLMIPTSKSEESSDDVNLEPKTSNHYFEHVIGSGETMWGITHKYNISEEELIALNPVLQTGGFPAGVTIKIPVKEVVAVESVNENEFVIHEVIPKETLYGLSQKYGVTIDDIKRSNPVLANRSPVIGEKLIIPRQTEIEQPAEIISENIVIEDNTIESAPAPIIKLPEVRRTLEIPATCIPQDIRWDTKIYTVSLFLPLYLEANDTLNREIILPEVDSTVLLEVLSQLNEDEIIEQDTLIEEEVSIEMFKQFYGNSENFLQFYEGALIAIDSLKKSGMKVILHVFDTQNNIETTRSIIQTPEFRGSDLIIGPVYQGTQNLVAIAAATNRIPMVSPVSATSNVIDQNPYYFQVNPSREYLAEKTADMVLEDHYNCNFIVVRTSTESRSIEARLVDLIREKYFNAGLLNAPGGVTFTEYNIKTEGSHGLRSIMSKQKENVVLIPSSLEGDLSIAISNINNLADDYSITLIATSNYQQRYPSIDLAQFHNLKMKYVYPYWVNYSDTATVEMITTFKQNFATEPSMFGMQGFDVTYYFLSALRSYGTDFGECAPYFHLPLVQGDYHFQKVSMQGGYMNRGVSVISYTPDYNVIRARVMGQPRLVVAQSE